MFTFDGNLKFVRIDLDYIKALHDACGEVFYSTVNYENKPYIGLLVTCDGHQYVIPLTSAKEKHKKWRDVDTDRFLIYEMADQARLGTRDIWTKADDPNEGKGKAHSLGHRFEENDTGLRRRHYTGQLQSRPIRRCSPEKIQGTAEQGIWFLYKDKGHAPR